MEKVGDEMHSLIEPINFEGRFSPFNATMIKSHMTVSKDFLKSTFTIALGSMFLMVYPCIIYVASRKFSDKD